MSLTPSPPMVFYSSEAEYRQHFENLYCASPTITFDGIPVLFRKSQFDHCMFESTHRDGIKDRFSRQRAERINWIAATLKHPLAELYVGWDSKKKRADHNSRVAVVYGDYVVVIFLKQDATGKLTANFITAYLANNSIGKIKAMQRWLKQCR